MRRGHFSPDDLPAWSVLNDVAFVNVKVADIKGRGYGLVAERDLVAKDDDTESPTLLTIPKDIILSVKHVEQYAKENKSFRQLLDAVGHQSTRGSILLFLLTQQVLASPDYEGGLGPSTPWTQYFSILPTQVPIPTMWTELELSRLKNTSLESAVSAKLTVLTREFDDLRASLSELAYWNDLLTIDEAITIRDWILLDALFRSRSLELPKSGESMVPGLDLVNHSSKATAYYDENDKGKAVLHLREGCSVARGDEITIDYGRDKSPAEMLFSYGFIDIDSTTRSLTLPLEPLDDDPLAKPKLAVFGKPPKLQITEGESGVARWNGDFVYLMCLNEEDGLDFKVVQETNGSNHLKMFWQDSDITNPSDTFKSIIQGHELYPIFELRALTVVLIITSHQLEELVAGQENNVTPGSVRPEIWQAATQLRLIETSILERSIKAFEDQVSPNPGVLGVLGIHNTINPVLQQSTITLYEFFSSMECY
ncbi:SET domain-containing protein [Hypoxylon trugodes]|uniref:SET domain-containing protein n=1 Tax=Hypoxylon trugodes TaxID=326681 RepID=UPI0021972658|nr:SET domain-containing protein [Hypoxylon trugodes]KAI1389844.1 SET domain-containing protein [Hypoxylon trugodes]